ncbi:MAG TPA: PEP/pyruvate-binding domain-containing protein [Candidatus Paceibacterota bacterium]|jgi:pyruvate,water dikinase|nr:PEP/pyruvate-binding domain-containing protein [Candidatus Paceibacterota bacterium]
MELIKDFKKINKDDVSLAGGKGASLGEMTQAGISVPPGFVICSSAFEKFLGETDLNVEIDAALETVNHKEMHTVDNASKKIEALILEAEMPQDIAQEIQKFFKNLNSKYVAVRSSATAEDSASAAWAGQLESYLNTTEENLLENVKKCWASLFTPRAIFYRFEKNLHKQIISVAVVVQKMIESEMSGIAFSVHPVTKDVNQMIIEACFGLGEAVVSGQITPDSYVVEKNPRSILDVNVEKQTRGLFRAITGGNEWQEIKEPKASSQVLTKVQILELADFVLKIEKHYGKPQDIEWALSENKFFILQGRPITTL